MTLVRNQDDVMRVIMEEFYYGCKIKNDAVAENDGICLKHVPVWAGDLVYRTDPIFSNRDRVIFCRILFIHSVDAGHAV